MLRLVLVLLTAVTSIGSACADIVVLAPPPPVVAGKAMHVTVLVTNESDASMQYTVPRRLQARLRGGERVFDLVLTEQGGTPGESFNLGPQSFKKLTFATTVPADVSGAVTLEIDGLAAGKTMFAVTAAPAPAAPPAAAQAPRPEQSAAIGDDAVSPGMFAFGLSAYEPIYFAVGSRDGWNAKFQLSFKYQLFNPSGEFARRHPASGDMYFGYTQTSLWDLSAPSSPFKDSSYRPSLFYYNGNLRESADNRTRFGLQAGLEHESNGQGGTQSRSINTAFVRPIFTLGDYGDYHWTIAPKLWVYLEKSDNPDIADYRGYGELLVKYGKKDKWQIAARLRKGTDAHVGSIGVDLSYPLRSAALGNLNGYLLLQYFDGWGETILDYNQRFKSQFRIGLMLVR